MIVPKSGSRGHIIIERIILTSPSFRWVHPFIHSFIHPSIGTSFLPFHTTESNSSNLRLPKFGNARTAGRVAIFWFFRNLVVRLMMMAMMTIILLSGGYGDRDGIDSTLA